VREFVAIGVQDRVEMKGLDRDLLFCCLNDLSKAAIAGSRLVQREGQVLKTLVALNLQHDRCSGFQGA
jgi:hypothetical protein